MLFIIIVQVPRRGENVITMNQMSMLVDYTKNKLLKKNLTMYKNEILFVHIINKY